MTSVLPRILAIDDTPANLKLLAVALGHEFDVHLALSGAEGLALARQETPDLILLDVMMPDMDGFETCRQFKSDPALAGVPLVFVTALSDSRSEIEGLALGAVDYLHKPIGLDIARQRIRNLLERAALERELAAHRAQLEQRVAERTAELQAANNELVAAQAAADCAIRAKSAFLANMGHELRTPLNAIIALNELIVRQRDEVQRVGMHARLGEAAQQMLKILKGILQLAELEGDKSSRLLESFNLREMINLAIAHSHVAAFTKGLSIRQEVAANLPQSAHGMAAALRQILENFLSNAVKFSSSGEIVVRASIDVADDDCVSLIFEVEDHGIGIAQEDVDRLFGNFSQLDESTTRRFGGLGIGLSIARHLAMLLGGRIDCRSSLGVGSYFSLNVPLYHYSYEGQLRSLQDKLVPPADDVAVVTVAADQAGVAARLADLDRLIELVSFDDLKSRQFWETVADKLAPLLGDELAPLLEALDSYAFDDARPILERARAALANTSD